MTVPPEASPSSVGRPLRLHVTHRIDDGALDQLAQHFEVTRGFGEGPVPLDHVIGDVDVLVIRKMSISNELLDRADRLRVIARAGIGLEGIDVEHATELGILVRNTPGTNSRTVAEHTVALALTASKDLLGWDALTRQGHADRRDESPVHEMYRKTWGIVGYGRIGREVAAIARDGLRMDVRVYLRPGTTTVDTGVSVAESLDELLASSDVVSLHVPLTDQTRGLIRARELTLMRDTAVLVNVARGGVVDSPALLGALSRRTIFAAAVDVWDPDFPSPPNPLYETPHLVIAPHRGGRSVEADAASGKAVVDVILGWLNEHVR